jgi:DNA repair exonuclease SbcCD ATPase subunit
MSEATDSHESRIAILRQQLHEENQRKATLEKAEADKAAAAALEAKQRAQERIEAQKQEHERRVAELRKREEEKAQAEALRKAQEKSEQIRLEQEAENLAEAIRVKAKRAAEEKALQDEVYRLEQENKRRIADLQQASIVKEEAAPVTLATPGHPLGMLFGAGAPPVSTIQEIDSVEVAKRAAKQNESDDLITLEASVWIPKKHGAGNCYVNACTSGALEKEIKRQTGFQANVQKVDQLSAFWDERDLLIAVKVVAGEHVSHPFSHDGFMARLEFLLESCSHATQAH